MSPCHGARVDAVGEAREGGAVHCARCHPVPVLDLIRRAAQAGEARVVGTAGTLGDTPLELDIPRLAAGAYTRPLFSST